jgi:pimeloyl-ACP methyl ester carboxylesterase
MLYSLGQGLLLERSVGDDTSTEFVRIDGDQHATTIVCLPWQMPYRLAVGTRLVPRPFLACYEMPRAIVSSEPELCIRSLDGVVRDARDLIARARLNPRDMLVVGLSIGNGAATMLANSIGARLCSIASADRGDLTLWESPAARHIRERAETKGYRLGDFTRALAGWHTIDNLADLGSGSRFVVGSKDEFLPRPRREGLVAAVHRVLPDADVSYFDSSHIGTMMEAMRRRVYDPASLRTAQA